MRESEKRELFRAAIEVLVARKVAAKHPDDPGAYAGTVRADLLTRHRDNCRDILACVSDNDVMDAETLALMLEPVSTPPPSKAKFDPPNPSAALPTVTAADWKPASDDEKSRSRQRIAEIRAELAERKATR